MSDIISDLDEILAAKEDIKRSLNDNGANVGDLMATYPEAIDAVASVKTVNGIGADSNKNVSIDASDITVDKNTLGSSTINQELDSKVDKDKIMEDLWYNDIPVARVWGNNNLIILIENSGSNYVIGDVLKFPVGTDTDVFLTVLEVDSNGGVEDYAIHYRRSYKFISKIVQTDVTPTNVSSSGSGLSITVKTNEDAYHVWNSYNNVMVVDGKIVNGGSGYAVNDLLYFTDPDEHIFNVVFQVTSIDSIGSVTAITNYTQGSTPNDKSFYRISPYYSFINNVYNMNTNGNGTGAQLQFLINTQNSSVALQDINTEIRGLSDQKSSANHLLNGIGSGSLRTTTSTEEVIGTYQLGYASFAEGYQTKSKGDASHAEGEGTIALSEAQHVQGKYNISDDQNVYAHILGNGPSENVRSNAHTIDWNGNAWYQGNVYVKGTNQSTGSHVLIADNTLVEYKYRDKTGLLDQNNLTNYIKEKYDSSCTGVASVEYCGEPGNNVMYAVYYYQGGYLTNWQIGIYKYHSPANDDVYVVQGTTRTSENGEINNVTSDTTSQAFLRYLYTTGLTNITIQYNGGGRFPEFYDCTTTYTLSGTDATCTCSGTNFSNYDSIRAKLTYSSGTVVYTDEYETSGGIVCFSKDTLIDTENGFKTIQDIEVGDKVYSYNFKTDEIELKEVDKIFNHNVNEIVNIYTEREIIKATKGHPFYIAYNQTKMAKNLKPNDLLRTKQNLFRPVKQIVINEVDNKEVYEIRVKDNNNYFVGSEGILVYNEPNIIE